ncbi:MAG: family 10 glycosylhydrolase [Clostridia bacterium]|nr:family 10 glycosylhydrolase [Clostridia bacterium]
MTRTIKAICVVLGLVFCISSVITPQNNGKVLADSQTIKGVWAATLYSMDYPSAPTQNSDVLMKDARNLVESVKKAGFNTLFLQVRPTGDAFYKSDIFPWSRYLTGTEGVAPQNNFDPLAYITKIAHEAGISVHAWINPYRLTASEKDSDNPAENSIAKKFSHLVKRHTDGKLYLDPGEPESIRLVVDGAVELAQNYDIDGIHIDDYFYPSSAFPDGETFSKYGGEFREIGDWRRNNTLELVKELKTEIKKVNPKLLFSVSPSGIWANKDSHPDGSNTSGRQAYFDYYADTRLWVKEELVDIIIPQIYWNIGYRTADFKELANWWNTAVRGTDVALCIGQGAYRIAEETDANSAWYGEKGLRELENQSLLIKALENCSGTVQYRLGSIVENPALNEFLTRINAGELSLFSDTNDFPWAKEAIESLVSKGIVKGMGDGTFGCARKVTRADFMVMLVRLSKQNVPFAENFADVAKDKYYYNEVGIAKALGFTTGREGNIFDPSGLISREDMATLAWRTLKKQGKLKESSNFSLEAEFSDANEISEYARLAVSSLAENQLLSGYETGEFNPKGAASRAECAVLLARLAEL